MNDLIAQESENSFWEGVQAERARTLDLLKYVESVKSPLIDRVIDAIKTGKEAVDIFSECLELSKPTAQQEKTSTEESLSAARAASMRRAFRTAAARVGTRVANIPNGDRANAESV
jgi:hypothetical protein